ncbi:MAG: protein O-mannosyl-transferase family, partial [Limisphaerales bacterium]
MKQNLPSSTPRKKNAPAVTPPLSPKAAENIIPPPLFRRVDWWAFGLTALLIFIGYFLTLAPDVTLEDSGELATGSFYAGVPHPPGYPVWTIFTWFFTRILPFSNIAWRVSVASAAAGALGCGLLALMVSRGSSMIIEGIGRLQKIDRHWENALCLVCGFVAGMLMGFNGYMWSQSVIVEVYSLSVLSLMGVLCFLLRWIYAPHQRRYLYFAFFLFGICLTNHMSLLVAAMGIEVAIMAAQPKIGRDLFLSNFLIYVVVLLLKINGDVTSFDNNAPLFVIFNFIGIGSLTACIWLALKTKGLGTEWKPVLIMGGMWLLGAAFYFYMPLASMSNPPMNWGYPRTAEGFMHALKRGQYESVHPTAESTQFFQQIANSIAGASEESNLVYLLIALIPLGFYLRQIVREGGTKNLFIFASITGGVGLLLGGLVLVEKQMAELARQNQAVEGLKTISGILFFLTLVLLLVDLVAALALIHRYMQKPERAWMAGLAAIYL